MMNILNGGKHADNRIDFQEFMIMPVGADSFTDALNMASNVFLSLKDILRSKKHSTNVAMKVVLLPILNRMRKLSKLLLLPLKKQVIFRATMYSSLSILLHQKCTMIKRKPINL